MFSFLKRRWFLLLIGFVLMAVFVWFAGPYFAFADYHPLEPIVARLIIIGLVVGVWLGSALLKRIRAARASAKIAAAVVKSAEGDRPSADAQKLPRIRLRIGAVNYLRAIAANRELEQYAGLGAAVVALPALVVELAVEGDETVLTADHLKLLKRSTAGK